jgi:hypothetical protein
MARLVTAGLGHQQSVANLEMHPPTSLSNIHHPPH